MQDVQDMDSAMNGEGEGDPMLEDASKDGLSTSEGARDQKTSGATSGGAGNGVAGRPGITRIPVPKFKGTTASSQSAPTPPGSRGPARYFIVKSNNHSNIEHSIKNGIWATQVCHQNPLDMH